MNRYEGGFFFFFKWISADISVDVISRLCHNFMGH